MPRGVTTHISVLHEKGHKEPWIIAMSDMPTKARVLDYGMRWGIDPMFSDFKSRGFGITKTQLQHADRIERLILVLTVALYWAASTGMTPPEKPKHYTQKKVACSLTSFFKRGLRILLQAALNLTHIPKLWTHANSVRW